MPLVATNDVHYLERQDATVHDVLLCIQTGKTVTETERMKFPTAEFYLKTQPEMAELFPDQPEAVANTLRIAERCNVQLELGKFHMPSYQLPEHTTVAAFLENLCRQGIKTRQINWDETKEARLQM